MKLKPGTRKRLFDLSRELDPSLGDIFQNEMELTSTDFATEHDKVSRKQVEMLEKFTALLNDICNLGKDALKEESKS